MTYHSSIGLDVHARSIVAAAFIPNTGEVIQKSQPPAYELPPISWTREMGGFYAYGL